MSDEVVQKIPFKQRKTYYSRMCESTSIRTKFPSKVPVIVERYWKEKYLPYLDKTKFLIPGDFAVYQLYKVIRNRMVLKPTDSIHLFIKDNTLASMSTPFHDVYANMKDEDGFLYITYASQETFGGESSRER